MFYILVYLLLLDFSNKVSGVTGSDNKDLSICCFTLETHSKVCVQLQTHWCFK